MLWKRKDLKENVLNINTMEGLLINDINDLYNGRIAICNDCYIFDPTNMTCSQNKWINLQTGETSTKKIKGFVNGCGCLLTSKAKRQSSSCPLGKW